jgi:ABC-type branched-subunit amino acid transport system ATPase component
MILSTSHLSKHFQGVTAVDNLSISIPQGKITGIVGPNGSGKTTLMNLISGMLDFDSGHLALTGVRLDKVFAYQIRDYGITRTFQNIRLFEQMSVLENILVTLGKVNPMSALFEKLGDLHFHQAQEVLKIAGLWSKKDELAQNLSYGQRKLLEIARVLAMKSEIMLFDEPFAGLFPEMVKQVEVILKNLRAQGKTIILIEHSMQIIRNLCDYLIVMDSGVLFAQGEPEEVLARGDVMEAYLGE